MCFRVTVSFEGLPIHAWSLSTALAILSSSCWIEAFDEASTSRADLSAFRLVAWSINPNLIPKEKTVIITEPELLPDGSLVDHGSHVFSKPSNTRSSREALSYNVLIHIHSVVDFASSANPPVPFAPSRDDSCLGGLPSDDPDHCSPRRHDFRTISGVADGSDQAGGLHEGNCSGRAGCGRVHHWKLPPMCSEVKQSSWSTALLVGVKQFWGPASKGGFRGCQQSPSLSPSKILNAEADPFLPIKSVAHVACQTDNRSALSVVDKSPAVLVVLLPSSNSDVGEELQATEDRLDNSPTHVAFQSPVQAPQFVLPHDVAADATPQALSSVVIPAGLVQLQNDPVVSIEVGLQPSPPQVGLEDSASVVPTVCSANVPLITFGRRVRKQLSAPLLTLPDLQQSSGKAIPENFSPRRSARLASKHPTAPVAFRAQLALAEKFGFSPNSKLSAMDVISKFQDCFNSPLHHHQIRALANLFRLTPLDQGPVDNDKVVVATLINSSVVAC